ncbi:MAG: [FeFe] hydrogenase H-cluster maturation GTPase HydF [Clostridia bacterium]|nr:[FeFe] hydrogenase H-cluster maturation GTPase HydF [Clostridia bacterium]
MSLNNTPKSDRVHIGIFGRRNAGKSKIINAITGQNLAIVSDVLGTTTDPVSKAMEILPLGPVVIIDTPGLDDTGELGKMRVEKAYQVINKTDIALVVIDITKGKTSEDEAILKKLAEKKIPCITVYNKADLAENEKIEISENEIIVSAETGYHINELKEKIASMNSREEIKYPIIADRIKKNDLVILVIPIDESAPKGRLILPQQQTIRELLECGAHTLCVRESELDSALKFLGKKPTLVITDSQAFKLVDSIVPDDVMLTSFSILFARHKGDLETVVKGVTALNSLKNGDTVLISEGCTHHRQCNDIGSVKLPKWICSYTGKNINFEYSSGTEFPSDLSKYQLIVHCGGCMLNEKEMKSRLAYAKQKNIPITNYGITIAFINGILKRSVEIFPDISDLIS